MPPMTTVVGDVIYGHVLGRATFSITVLVSESSSVKMHFSVCLLCCGLQTCVHVGFYHLPFLCLFQVSYGTTDSQACKHKPLLGQPARHDEENAFKVAANAHQTEYIFCGLQVHFTPYRRMFSSPQPKKIHYRYTHIILLHLTGLRTAFKYSNWHSLLCTLRGPSSPLFFLST